jgi:hypothetical protein
LPGDAIRKSIESRPGLRDGIGMLPAHERFEKATRRWLDLAERRLAYYDALYCSGRWRRYFPTETLFARRMLDVMTVTHTFRRLAGPTLNRPRPAV